MKGNGTSAFTAVTAPTGTIVGTTDTQTLTNKTLGATTVSGTFSFADNALNRPYLNDVAEVVSAHGSSGGGTETFDLSVANNHSVTVTTSANTFSFTNPPASGRLGTLTLIITNGGSQTVTWPASVDWPGGTAPTLTASGVDVITLFTLDAGTIWYGFASGTAMA